MPGYRSIGNGSCTTTEGFKLSSHMYTQNRTTNTAYRVADCAAQCSGMLACQGFAASATRGVCYVYSENFTVSNRPADGPAGKWEFLHGSKTVNRKTCTTGGLDTNAFCSGPFAIPALCKDTGTGAIKLRSWCPRLCSIPECTTTTHMTLNKGNITQTDSTTSTGQLSCYARAVTIDPGRWHLQHLQVVVRCAESEAEVELITFELS